jgi:hypothetical protein
LALVALTLLGACQTAPQPAAPDTAKAACVGQAYLRANGFLNAAPQARVVLLDSDLRYEVDGVLQYERLLKDRRNRFSRKLKGVWSRPESTKYLVVYGPIERRQHCVGVKHDFSFAYVRKSCDADGVFTKLRERDLKCEAD